MTAKNLVDGILTAYYNKLIFARELQKRKEIMNCNVYITDEEREKCRRVAAAFAELKQEELDVVVTDAGRYGFVRLSYYNKTYGFGKSVCYTDSQALFNALWEDWLHEQLFQIALNHRELINMNYAEILRSLPEKTQSELRERHRYFAEKAGLVDI